MTVIRRHPLLAYCVLAYAITWLLVSPLVGAAWGIVPVLAPAWHALGAFGPVAAAVIVTAIIGGKQGLRAFAARLVRWRVPPGWWLLALSPLLLFVLSAVAVRIVTGAWPGFGHFLYDPTLVLSWLAGIIYGIGEEPGWRGFALPRLQERHNALSATLLVAAIWVCWHAPFFIYRFAFSPSQFIGFAIGIAAGAIWLTCLYNGSGGSVLLAIVYHASLNAVYQPDVASSGVLAIMTTAIIAGAILTVLTFGPGRLAPHQSNSLRRSEPVMTG